MLSPGISFPDMCFLELLVDGLNFQKYFTHLQKYPRQRAAARVVWQWRAVASGGLTAVGGGPAMVEGNQWWVAMGDNRGNLVFSQGKTFSSHDNVVISYEI